MTTTATVISMTENDAFRGVFSNSFYNTLYDMGLDIFDNDTASPTPWGAPWEWAEALDYIVPDLSITEMGARWARMHADEIRDLLAAEEEARLG